LKTELQSLYSIFSFIYDILYQLYKNSLQQHTNKLKCLKQTRATVIKLTYNANPNLFLNVAYTSNLRIIVHCK